MSAAICGQNVAGCKLINRSLAGVWLVWLHQHFTFNVHDFKHLCSTDYSSFNPIYDCSRFLNCEEVK